MISCCNGAKDCRQDNYFFKKACPKAYSYAQGDDVNAIYQCPSSQTSSYTITFCPSSSLARLVQSVQLSSPPSISPSSFGIPISLPSPIPPIINLPKNSSQSPSNNGSKRKRTILLVGLTISAAISILLLYGIWACIRKKEVIRTSTKCNNLSEIKYNAVLDSLQYELNTIRTATNNFALDNKLGEGGFGEVYKGKLENGQEIAVKRLSEKSEQGDTEFKAEVILVAKLRHKNLVKLLGFCVALEEKILVYEFLPNSSLDKFLFDHTKQPSLDWQTRFKIIVGIARGLLNLHEDSPLKVIHRDLKSSNILLNGKMNPKIADFGLAKLFGVDQSQGDT